jgi:ornithine cyclodeaminase/alanine dehydrogenase-like protein (mu-crystallin family)
MKLLLFDANGIALLDLATVKSALDEAKECLQEVR